MKNEEQINIYGRHPVLEALKQGVPLDKLYLKKGSNPKFVSQVKRLAGKQSTPISYVDEASLDRRTKNANHQGVLARKAKRRYESLDEILEYAEKSNQPVFLLVLNEVQDPQNLGSLIRTAVCAGVHGIVIPKRRAARVTSTVSKVSAGAESHMKISIVTNISDTLEELKQKGILVAGAEADGDISASEFNYNGPVALVLGGEDKGLGQRVRNTCDKVITIPIKNNISSLNVGVAGGILMFKIMEKRLK
ncbi:MAG: 23S rRNA (guanosine(2251)-2'-O)-methyltransferase RlmB [Vulcanimicrobiota bacterium]